MDIQQLKEQIELELMFWKDDILTSLLHHRDSVEPTKCTTSILSLLDSPDSPYILKSEAEKRIREIVNPFEAAYNINACRTYLDMKTGFNSAIQKAVELFEVKK